MYYTLGSALSDTLRGSLLADRDLAVAPGQFPRFDLHAQVIRDLHIHGISHDRLR